MILDMLDNGSPSHIAIAVSGAGPVVTYDQLRRQVDSFAASLNQVGLGRGDRIAMALPNGLEPRRSIRPTGSTSSSFTSRIPGHAL